MLTSPKTSDSERGAVNGSPCPRRDELGGGLLLKTSVCHLDNLRRCQRIVRILTNSATIRLEGVLP